MIISFYCFQHNELLDCNMSPDSIRPCGHLWHGTWESGNLVNSRMFGTGEGKDLKSA